MTNDDDRDASRDRALGMDRAITRRDFLNGVAVGAGAIAAGRLFPHIGVAAAQFAQDTPGYYPPALTGMRGSHDGSFDVSHLVRDGRFQLADHPTDTGESYDLVV